MKKSIGDFVEDYVAGEPLTMDTLAWAIRKYTIRSIDPSDEAKILEYETFLHKIAEANIAEDQATVNRLLRNASLWHIAHNSDSDPEGDRNEAFHNINTIL